MRVVVADDTALTRAGIIAMLRTVHVDVVGEADDAASLHREIALSDPDLVVVDIRMPPTHTDEGLVAAERILLEHPQVGVLVLSQYIEPAYAMRLLQERPERVGYLLKERVYDAAVLLDALRRLQDGETVVDPTIVHRLLGRRRPADPLESLSDRERDVLALAAEGFSNSAIAERLFITPRTVEAHLTSIFAKLNITAEAHGNRRVLATLTFLRSPGDPA